MSLEGTVLVERKDANKDFYGQPIPAKDLLEGKVPAPEAASSMYEVIEAAEAVDETHVPEKAFIPSQNPGGQAEPVTPYSLSGKEDSAGGSTAAPGNAGGKPIFDA